VTASALDTRCPCLSGEVYGACCAPFHRGESAAPTAERLMRSRYSAFVFRLAGYLLETWHPRTRPAELELDPDQRWFRLDILRTERGSLADTDGVVEFRAHYRLAGAAAELHETSRFVRLDRRWLYLDAL
jgi:SEC-C motif-containing protein